MYFQSLLGFLGFFPFRLIAKSIPFLWHSCSVFRRFSRWWQVSQASLTPYTLNCIWNLWVSIRIHPCVHNEIITTCYITTAIKHNQSPNLGSSLCNTLNTDETGTTCSPFKLTFHSWWTSPQILQNNFQVKYWAIPSWDDKYKKAINCCLILCSFLCN